MSLLTLQIVFMLLYGITQTASVWMTRWTKLQKPAASLAVVLLLCNIGLLTYSLNLTDDAVMYLAQIIQKLLLHGM